MPTLEGCKEAREISLTRKGAMQMAHALVRKSLTPDPSPNPAPAATVETTDMDIAIIKKLAVMDDVTKAYFLAMDDAAGTAFMAKSADEQKAEAVAEAAKTQAAKDVETAKALGISERELAAEKRASAAESRLADLEKREGERELEKRAGVEFAGYPGGVNAVVPILKAAAGLPQAQREEIEKGLKTTADIAKATGRHLSLITEEEFHKTAPTTSEIQKRAAQIRTNDPLIGKDEAIAKAIAADPELLMGALAEEGAFAAG